MSIAGITFQVVTTFNLICTGTNVTGTLSVSGSIEQKLERPFTDIYRVDLTKGRWCVGLCTFTRPIARVAETTITLVFDERPDLSSVVLLTVNRETGALFDQTKIDKFIALSTGTCERAPFTGFPERKF